MPGPIPSPIQLHVDEEELVLAHLLAFPEILAQSLAGNLAP